MREWFLPFNRERRLNSREQQFRWPARRVSAGQRPAAPPGGRFAPARGRALPSIRRSSGEIWSVFARAMVAMGLLATLVAACNSRATPEARSACAALSAPDPAIAQQIDGEAIDLWLFDAALLHAVNAERCRRGLTPLAADPALGRAAAYHSGDMVVHDFFDHASPVAGRATLRERYAQVGADYARAAENIATLSLYAVGERHFVSRNPAACDFAFSPGGPSIPRHTYASAAEALLENWMDSGGHRQNILHPGMTRHGAGVALKPDARICGTLIAVQNFAG